VSRLALVLSLFVASTAHADGIPTLPPCPDGTRMLSCHGPRVCAPDACTTDADCDGGDACRDVSLCSIASYCGGGRPPPDATSTGFAATSYERSCSEGCSAGESCAAVRVCVAPSGPTHTTYCGCHAAGAGRGGASLAIATLAIAILARRRR
jgi:hypothetical protein